MVFTENLHILSIGFQCHVPIHFHAKNGQFYSSTNNLAILKSECPIYKINPSCKRPQEEHILQHRILDDPRRFLRA